MAASDGDCWSHHVHSQEQKKPHDLLFLLLSFLHSSSIQGPAYYKKVLPTATESALISVIKISTEKKFSRSS